MHPERFEFLAHRRHPRALLPPRRIPHRPARRGEPRGDHARPFRSRTPRPRPCACHARDARPDEDAARHRGEARHADACLWRDVAGWRRDGEARACGTRARQRPGGDRVAGTPRRDLRRLQAKRRPDQSFLRARPLRSLRHRGDVRAPSVQPWRCARAKSQSCSDR